MEIASGVFEGDLGRWRYVAFEIEGGLCDRFETDQGGAWGGCTSVPMDDAMSVGTSDGSGTIPYPPEARARVTPEVALVRFELASGEVIEVEPVDVGLPLSFALTVLEPGDRVERVVALDADGRVLESMGNLAPVN
jgi:hypothetical protein